MRASKALEFIRTRLAGCDESELSQSLVRFVIVSIVLAYFFSSFFASRIDAAGLHSARFIVSVSLTISTAIIAAIVWRPVKSIPRRLFGMVHDVAAISAALYLGEGAGAAVAVIYLWITVGNGFRYGIRYLCGSAVLSISGFVAVYLSSEFWQSQGLLSVNILLSMLIVPPYVGSLLRSLHSARDALQHQASTDTLTGLLSRMEMENAIASLFLRNGAGHVLLYCDLDRFKAVNDSAGHAAGDKLLTDVGEIIRKSVRRGDLSARMGGDEFCVLLHDCALEKARKIAEEIRSKISGYRLAWGTDYFSVAVSVGVAPSDAVNDADSLFRLADAACYAAKNAGRNKVHVIDPRIDSLDTHKIRRLFERSPKGQKSADGIRKLISDS